MEHRDSASQSETLTIAKIVFNDMLTELARNIHDLEHHSDFCRNGVDEWLAIWREGLRYLQELQGKGLPGSDDSVIVLPSEPQLLDVLRTVTGKCVAEQSLERVFRDDPDYKDCADPERLARLTRILNALDVLPL